MTADPRAGTETIHPPVEEFDQWCRDHPNRAHLVPLGYWNGGYRAGYAAGLAHATTPAESAPFVCDVCGKAATIGFGIGVGRTFAVVRCVDHLPGWVPDA